MTVSYRYSMRFPGSREQINQACLEAVRQSGFTIRESDRAAGQISARARVNFRSWGERIHVYVDTENRVDITSESRYPLTLVDWGKNRWNVERIFTRLTSLLGGDT
jgi:uncharacterized protein DUF1499